MSIRAVFFRMMMRAQNINPIAHPGMKDKMKQMSAKYSHTKPKKGYTLECLTTANGTKYQRLIRDRTKPSGKVIYYIHGGCSPIGMKKQFHTTIHHTAAEYETIMFSGGKIGCQIEMSLADLQKIVPVATADIL